MENILVPKYRKGKKPARVRKPSRPLDGINRRLLKAQEDQPVQAADEVVQEVAQNDIPDENMAPTRIEMVEKAKELGLKFTKRTSDEKLLEMINTALQGE